MSQNFEETRVFSPNDKNTNQRKNTKKNNSNRKKSKKRKPKRKFKAIYLIPIVLIVSGLIFGFYLWQATNTDGPVYGDRCTGVVDIDNGAITTTVSEFKSNDSVKDISIDVACRQIKIDLETASGVSISDAEDIVSQALKRLDELAGYDKSEGNTYSNLLGTINEVQQYNVDVIIKSASDESGFPSFGTKHPNTNKISFTRNETRDPELADKLINGSDEDDLITDEDVDPENSIVTE